MVCPNTLSSLLLTCLGSRRKQKQRARCRKSPVFHCILRIWSSNHRRWLSSASHLLTLRLETGPSFFLCTTPLSRLMHVAIFFILPQILSISLFPEFHSAKYALARNRGLVLYIRRLNRGDGKFDIVKHSTIGCCVALG